MLKPVLLRLGHQSSSAPSRSGATGLQSAVIPLCSASTWLCGPSATRGRVKVLLCWLTLSALMIILLQFAGVAVFSCMQIAFGIT